MKITKGEFIQHTSKYLKPSCFVLTRYGVPCLRVTIEPAVTDWVEAEKDKLKTKPKVAKDRLYKNPKEGKTRHYNKQGQEVKVEDPPTFGRYGCGCKKVEGKQLCPKHSRR